MARTHCAAPDACRAKRPDGHCRPCAARAALADPEVTARRIAGQRATLARPEMRAKWSAAKRAWHERHRDDPAVIASLQASGRRLRASYDASPDAQARNLETRARVGAQLHERAMSWLPRAYRAEYRRLRRMAGSNAAEARRIILDQVERDRADAASARAARPLSFEEKLARIASGAGIVERPDTRPIAAERTLAGIASGLL